MSNKDLLAEIDRLAGSQDRQDKERRAKLFAEAQARGLAMSTGHPTQVARQQGDDG